MAINLPSFIVDAFASNPFTGNPAAVCLLPNEESVSDQLKQKIAAEFNLSETAFVIKCKLDDSFEKDNQFDLRWFTPKTEVPLCGHATLSSAAVLFHIYGNQASKLYFKTKSGLLVASKKNKYISLDMPINKPNKLTFVDKSIEELIKIAVGSLPYDEVLYHKNSRKLLIRLNDSLSRNHLEKINPSPQLMIKTHDSGKIKGLIVTLRGRKEEETTISYDFLSRYFAPWAGIDEDPVTGSAHTVLGPYWSEILNKKELIAYQCSPRGGALRLTLRGDQRIDISGEARILFRGNLQL